ncbi:MAG: HDOD domain-containing protein [bacterium]
MSQPQQFAPAPAGTLKRLLGSRAFFKDAPADTFLQAQRCAQIVTTNSNTPLLTQGDTSPYAWFLIEGAVTLKQQNQSDRVLKATEPDAGYPIANLRPANYTVQPELQTTLVRMEQSFLKKISRKPRPARFLGGTEMGGGSWQSHRFAVEVIRIQASGEFKIPALPGVSARISQAMQDPDFAISDLARLISADPAIAGGLLNIANSALFRGADLCETLNAAIVRLGLAQTRTLVMTLAAKSLFSARRPWIRTRLNTMWRHAVEVGAYATVLARLDRSFDNAKALLLGLLHEIGAVPILELADRFPELENSPGILDAVLANEVPHLSAQTLSQWGLHDFADAALHQENWFFEHDDKTNYTDLLIVAHLHGLIKARRFKDLPRLNETPAFANLSAAGLSAKVSLTILEEAQQELAELRALLTT